MKGLAGKEVQSSRELRNNKHGQENYYETGSESDESEQAAENVMVHFFDFSIFSITFAISAHLIIFMNGA